MNGTTRQRTISKSDDETRQKMKKYWEVYEPSLESMMLSSEACYLSENEQNEVFSYLPAYKGLRVLELGAGIGRYTTPLAEAASEVVAVDFMESYTKVNERINGHRGNITFICGDVTKLDFPVGSFDLVFSNWLLMYLTDEETEGLMESILAWLKPDGHFFFRESCYHQSGNRPRTENPTHYRTPLDYINILHSCAMEDDIHGFDLISAKNILTYTAYHGNPNQLCFLSKKLKSKSAKPSFKNAKYIGPTSEEKNIMKWVSTTLNLDAKHRILNLSCGTGSSSILLVENSGAFVHGVDSNPMFIYRAIENQGKLDKKIKSRIQFEYCNIFETNLNANSYDRLVFIEDIKETAQPTTTSVQSAIKLAQSCLKDDGKFLFSAYVTGKNRSNLLENTFSMTTLRSQLQDHDLSLVDVTQKNATATSRCRDLEMQECEKQLSDQSEERLKQLDLQICCLRDGRLDWVVVTATKETN